MILLKKQYTSYVAISIMIIFMLIIAITSSGTIKATDDMPKSEKSDKKSDIKTEAIIETENLMSGTTVQSAAPVTETMTETIATTSTPKTEVEETPPEVESVENEPISTYESIEYIPAEYEMWMMCAVVSSEAGYCDDITQKAVAHTIINRLRSDDFPNSIYMVLTQENQYTAVDCYFTGNYREGLAPGSDGWNHTMQLCYEVFNDWDFTGGAVAYYNPYICGWDNWFESLIWTYTDTEGQRYFRIN